MPSTADFIRALHASIPVGGRQEMAKFLTNPAITKEVLNGHGEDGDTPLITAVNCTNRYMVTLLLIAGADVNIRNKKGDSALLRSTLGHGSGTPLAKKLEIMRILLEAGVEKAEIESTAQSLKSWTHGASSAARDINKLLTTTLENLMKEVESDANWYVKSSSAHELDMRLLNASKKNETNKIKELLAAGADPNRYFTKEKDGYAYYPLHHAVNKQMQFESSPIVELLSHGAYPKHSGAPMTVPPLYLAAAYCSAWLVEILIKHGADVNASVSGGNNDGETALHAAFEYGQGDTISLLLKNKASATAKTRQLISGRADFTPLQLLILKAPGYLDRIMNFVIPTYPNIGINEVDSAGLTPAMMLAMGGGQTTGLLERFVKLPGIDLNLTDKQGNTALHHAVISSNFAMIKALCQVRGPDNAIPQFMNVRNVYGYTALDLECTKDYVNSGTTIYAEGNAKMINQLIDHGADPNAWTIYDKKEKATPLICFLKRYPKFKFSDPAKVLGSLYAEAVDEEKVLETFKAAISITYSGIASNGIEYNNSNKMIHLAIDTIMQNRGFDFAKSNDEGGVLYFDLLNLAVENSNLYAVKKLIAVGSEMGVYSDKERALRVAIVHRNSDAENFLLSIGADPFLPVTVPSYSGHISACKFANNGKDKELVALMIYSYLIRIPYVYSADDISYIVHMEKTIHSELPVFLAYDDPARAYQDDILKLILQHVVELVRQQKDAQSKFAILNKVIGYEHAYPETVLSKFLRESGNENVISSLRKELTLVRARATAASLPGYDDNDSDQAQEITYKPTPSSSSASVPLIPMDVLPTTAIAPDPEPVPTSQPATVIAAPVSQDPLFLEALQALKEKHQREMEALRAQIDNAPQVKDREIATLKAENAALRSALRLETIKNVTLEAQQFAAGNMVRDTLRFLPDKNSVKNDGVPFGIIRPPK